MQSLRLVISLKQSQMSTHTYQQVFPDVRMDLIDVVECSLSRICQLLFATMELMMLVSIMQKTRLDLCVTCEFTFPRTSLYFSIANVAGHMLVLCQCRATIAQTATSFIPSHRIDDR